MKKFLVFVFILLPFLVSAQTDNKSGYFSQHIISAEFGGLGLYLINYENIVNPQSKLKLAFGVGGSYVRLNEDEKCLLTQIKTTALFGKGPFYAGAGFSFLGVNAEYLVEHRNQYEHTDDVNIYVIPYFHFRYQAKENGIFTSISAHLLKDSDYGQTLDVFTYDIFHSYGKNFAILPSVSVGYTFNSRQ